MRRERVAQRVYVQIPAAAPPQHAQQPLDRELDAPLTEPAAISAHEHRAAIERSLSRFRRQAIAAAVVASQRACGVGPDRHKTLLPSLAAHIYLVRDKVHVALRQPR